MIGPAAAQKLLPDMTLPPSTPKPCSANTVPAITSSAPTALSRPLIMSCPFVLAGRRGGRRPAPPVRLDRAHQPDAVAVRVINDGVPGAPERVVGDLPAVIAGRGKLGVQVVHRLPGRHVKAEHDATRGRA